MKSIHPNLTAALDDPTGLAVLGFFIDVRLPYLLYVLKHFQLLSCKRILILSFLAGCLRRQRALWAHITKAVLCCLQRLEDTHRK